MRFERLRFYRFNRGKGLTAGRWPLGTANEGEALFSFSRREVSITGDSHSHPPTRQCRPRQMKDPDFSRIRYISTGFISLRMTFAPYKDTYNGMWFSLDKEFIQSGKTGQIEENPAGYAKLYKMLRDLFLMEYGTVTI